MFLSCWWVCMQRKPADLCSITWPVDRPTAQELIGLAPSTKQMEVPNTKAAAQTLESSAGSNLQPSESQPVPASSSAVSNPPPKKQVSSKQQAGSSAVVERVNRFLGLHPWQVELSLMENLSTSLHQKLLKAGGRNAKAQQHLQKKARAAAELNRLLQGRWTQVRSSLNALQLAPVFQAPMEDYIRRCESHLTDLKALEAGAARLAASAKQPSRCIALADELCEKAERITACLSVLEAGVKETLRRALKTVCTPSLQSDLNPHKLLLAQIDGVPAKNKQPVSIL